MQSLLFKAGLLKARVRLAHSHAGRERRTGAKNLQAVELLVNYLVLSEVTSGPCWREKDEL